jgi:hypothetical protein
MKLSVNMVKDGSVLTTESDYATMLQRESMHALRYIAADALEACFALPEGINSVYYAIEVKLCCAELIRRIR